jgi:hypothetical protein
VRELRHQEVEAVRAEIDRRVGSLVLLLRHGRSTKRSIL